MTETAVANETITVLLVEDSPTEAMLIQAAIADAHAMEFDVEHVDSLSAAQTALNLRDYDIVILDLTLPDSSGIETFVKIHTDFPSLPVVILTANSSRDTGIKSVQLGAQDYILKEQIENMQLGLSLRYAIERKKSAEAVRQAHDQLEEAYQELQGTQAQLVQNEKLASIGQLAAGVAHEMNTPLGFVNSNLETLKGYITKFQAMQAMSDKLVELVESQGNDELKTLCDDVTALRKKLKIDFVLEDADTLFEESQEGIDTLASIVQSLRDFTRIDQAEDWSDYDIEQGIDSALMMIKNETKDIDITVDKGDVPAIHCNPTQINEVLLNILRNAIEAFEGMFEPPSPCSIHIRTSMSDDGCVVCEIGDNGPGIDEEVLAKIYDPFFTTKPVGAGKGLGLSTAHDIVVKKHRGALKAVPQGGAGIVFRITLPLKAQQTIVDSTDKEGVS